MKTTTSVTSLAQSPPARFLAMVLQVATPINQLGVGVARQVKIVTRLALFGTKLRRALTVAAIIAVGAATGPAPAFAVVITVSNTADSGAGSLRAALASANNGDTVDATGVSGTITLASGLSVAKSLTILGPGANVLTVSGNNAGFRVFYIEAHTPSTTSTIDGITITSGHIDGGQGAGIYNNDATLTLRNCTVSNCSVGAGGNGGGIYNTANATLTILNTTIAGNYATAHGAISNHGAMEIDSSTISGNTAYSVSAIGNNGALTILNSTFSGNSAELNGAISVCGLVGPDSDLHMAGTLRIGSTILNASSLSAGSSYFPCPDSVTSLGYNLSSGAEGGDGTTGPGGFLNATGDIRNTNPLLGPLQDNGGPTLTHAPLDGSPAIDAGKNFSGSTTDQRGAPRNCDNTGIPNAVGGDGTDIGAFELQISCNQPPVAQCISVTVPANSSCVANASVDNASYDPDAGDTIAVSQSPAGPYALGVTTVTLTVTDSHGASSTCTATVTVVDTTLPSLGPCPVNQSVTASSIAGAVATFATPTATDNCSVSVSCDHASGSTFPLGSTQVTCTAVDGSGNSVQCSFTVNVTYSWSGFLQPINADGTSVFKLGSTVPVKFQLTGASARTANAVAKLSYTKIGNGAGTVNEAASTAAADAGNTFRYDATSSQYIFNWSTKGLTSGSYQLKVDLGDGVSRTVNLSSK